MELKGLHHVTAVTGNPSLNVAFYTEVLGMRLLKKTVNQDDVAAYHLFYGDGAGSAAAELTFFEWPFAGPALKGAGAVSAVALRVPGPDALRYWKRRLAEFGVPHEGTAENKNRAFIRFRDPEGQPLELVDDGATPSRYPAEPEPWSGSPVPVEMGIKGLHSVRIPVATDATERLLTLILGFRQTGEYENGGGSVVEVFETGSGGGGTEVHLERLLRCGRGRTGVGGVHHIAFRTPDDSDQAAWRCRLLDAGVGTTPVIDRFYFRSVYFHEPGGVLFEIATDGPGLTIDEDSRLPGKSLSLPPFLEPRRSEIEAGLRPIRGFTMTAVRRTRPGGGSLEIDPSSDKDVDREIA